MSTEVFGKTSEVLLNGGIILYPTDTIWGIGCMADNMAAIEKVFALKQRPRDKQMICLVDSAEMIARYAPLTLPDIKSITDQFDERPTSIVFEQVNNLPPSLILDAQTVAFRITRDAFSKQLVSMVNVPLVATSANISGGATAKVFNEIPDEIVKGVDYVVPLHQDRGASSPSRVVKITKEGIIILRD